MTKFIRIGLIGCLCMLIFGVLAEPILADTAAAAAPAQAANYPWWMWPIVHW